MKFDNIANAEKEAKRFLASIEGIRARSLAEIKVDARYRRENFPKESAAIKRASMDLTRALAKMRNDV